MLKKLFSILLSAIILLSVLPTGRISSAAASNESTIFNFLVDNMGLNTAAACGVLANIEKESGFRNNVLEYGYTWESGGGYGICQWTNSPRTSSTGRRTNLVNWCSNNGYDYTSLIGQLNFLKHELNLSYYYNLVTNRLYNASNSADGAYQAGYYWCYYFEVPAGYNTGVSEIRGNYAKNTYWPAYSGEHISPVAEVTLSNYNYPTNLSVGEAFYFTGTISAPIALEWAYISIVDANNNVVRSKGIDPGSTSVDIATQLDPYISMSTLPAGKYMYWVEATDYNHNYKILHQNWFNIGAVLPTSTVPTVSPGTSATNTTFTWNATSNTTSYDLKIYSGTSSSNSTAYRTILGISGTSYSCNLPVGTYIATLASVNSAYYDCWKIGSDSSAFTVVDNEGAGGSQGSYTSWSEWSPWQDTPVTETELCDVEMNNRVIDHYKTQYTYYHYSITRDDGGVVTYPGDLSTYRSVSTHGVSATVHSIAVDSPLTYGGTLTTGDGWVTSYYTGYGCCACEPYGTDDRWWYGNADANPTTQSVPVYKTQYRFRTREIADNYIVSYDANGGIGAPEDQIKTQGISLTLRSDAPTRIGYTFQGWGTGVNPTGVEYGTGASYTSDSDVILYAVWTANTYTVTFNANGGECATTSKTVTYDTTYNTLPSPTKTGFIFNGWYTELTGNTRIRETSIVEITAAQTLYAQWTEITLTNIAIKTMPNKTSYNVGDTLNTTGLTLTATYSDNSTQTISTNFTCSPVTLGTAGPQAVTVTYGGKTATFTVTVVDSTPDPDAPQLVVSNPRGTAGSTVDVTVSLQNNPGIMAARYSINYDNSKLELISVTDGGLMGASLFDPGNVLTDVPYSVCWNDAGTTNYSEDGVMVTFKFRILDETAVGTTPVTLTIDQGSTFNSNLESVVFATVNGTVEITDRTPGDANGDTTIDLKDVVIIRRYLAGGWNVTLDASSADVNGDNTVDLKDVVILRRHLAGGWGVVLK